MEESKVRALNDAIKEIDKKFGKGAVIKMGDKPAMNVNVIPTGCLELDIALGVGGLPLGRIVEIYGPESSGKTTVALHCAAEAQKAGGIVAFIDAEHALDPAYARRIGVDIDNLYVSQPQTGEQALDIVEALVRSGAIDMVIVDSVAALVPQEELEGDMSSTHVGLQARMMSMALRKLAGALSKSKCVAIFINQLREKIITYGNPEVTPGGKALKFYASVRIDVRKSTPIKQGDTIIGNKTNVKISKNKVAAPFKTAEFDLMYGTGISKESSLINLGVECGVIEKNGTWLSYNGDRMGQGKENAKTFLREYPEIAAEIERKVLEQKDILSSKLVLGDVNDD